MLPPVLVDEVGGSEVKRGEPLVFTISGQGRTAVRGMLERVAERAAGWSDEALRDLAHSLAARGPRGPCRVAIIAATPPRLAERARQAARRTSHAPEGRLVLAPGMCLGVGVRGRVTLLFSGRDPSGVRPGAVEASLRALRTLDLLGLNAGAAIGDGLGEIVGLVWAGSLTPHAAGRLGRVLAEKPADIDACLADVRLRPVQRPLISALTGRAVEHDDDLRALLRAPVAAATHLEEALAQIAPVTDLFCETGPGHDLAARAAATGVPTVGGDAMAGTRAAALWAAAAIPDISPLYDIYPAERGVSADAGAGSFEYP